MIEYFKELISSPAALLGLTASIVVLISMCFNARSRRSELIMRWLNLAGSILSVIYGFILGPAGCGMIILNGTLVFVNIYFIIRKPKQSSVE